MEMSRLTRDGTAEPVSRDQFLGREERGQGNVHFPCSPDHVQDWQPSYPSNLYYCYMYDHTVQCSMALKVTKRSCTLLYGLGLALNASLYKPSEHPPNQGGGDVKRSELWETETEWEI